MIALKIGFVLLCLASSLLNYIFLRRLRLRHSHAWENLGRPTLIANNSPQNSLATMRYIMSAEYKELDDPGFVRYCNFLRLFNVLTLVLVASAIVLIASNALR
jgi:hypothetical protein